MDFNSRYFLNVKRKLLTAAAAAVCLAGTLTGCHLAGGNAPQGQAVQENKDMNRKKVTVEDFLTICDWFGKSPEEVGITADADDYSDLSSKIFGHSGKGSIRFKTADGKSTFVEAWIKVDDLSIDDCYLKLADLYSGAAEGGMIPYLEGNGGAVDWFEFDAGDARVKLSKASKRNYIEVEIKRNENPSRALKLRLKEEPTEPEISFLPLEILLKVTDYDNGVITALVTNEAGCEVCLNGEYYISKMSEDGDGYYSMDWMTDGYTKPFEELVLQDLETAELKYDLREYGKVEPGEYLLRYDILETVFTLEPEE